LLVKRVSLKELTRLKFAASQNEESIVISVVCYNASNLELELVVPEYEFRSLLLGLIIAQNWSSLKLIYYANGKSLNLLLLSTEGRRRILMGYIFINNQEITVNQEYLAETEIKTNFEDKKISKDTPQLDETKLNVISFVSGYYDGSNGKEEEVICMKGMQFDCNVLIL
jgi:hypothetical protein